MQTASSRIWTQVTVSISYNGNHYTINTSKCTYVYTCNVQGQQWYYSTHSLGCICVCMSIYICICVQVYVYVCVCKFVFTQPLHHRQDVTQGQFFSGVQVVLNLEFPFCKSVAMTRLKSLVYPTNYPQLEETRDELMSFLKALAESQIQTTSSKIWTQVSNSISYDNNHCTKPTYTQMFDLWPQFWGWIFVVSWRTYWTVTL